MTDQTEEQENAEITTYRKDCRMDTQERSDLLEIDIMRLAKLLWQRAWIIIVSMILLGAIFFSYAMFFVTPQYKSSAMLYVNNTTVKVGSTAFSISASELNAAKTLLDLYVVILKSRVTLEEVIERADLDYTYESLYNMVRAGSVNGTEIFKVEVTTSDPDEAKLIVDTIVQILPDRIAEIVDGSSVRLVDEAVTAAGRSGPSYTRYASIGMVVGMLLGCAIIIVPTMLDTTVWSEEYLAQKYGDIPILAVVPDGSSDKKYFKYYRNYYGYGRSVSNKGNGQVK